MGHYFYRFSVKDQNGKNRNLKLVANFQIEIMMSSEGDKSYHFSQLAVYKQCEFSGNRVLVLWGRISAWEIAGLFIVQKTGIIWAAFLEWRRLLFLSRHCFNKRELGLCFFFIFAEIYRVFHELFWNSSSTHLLGFWKRRFSVTKILQLGSNG